MIFVTVGTHEQQFDRLIKYMDELKESAEIEDEVIMQTGYCFYEPKHCAWSKWLPYKEMVRNVYDARIVITHGGPSSFIMPLQLGKIPIVVPRQKKFNEHVNDHQLNFSKAVAERQRNIIVVEEMEQLEHTLLNYVSIAQAMPAGLKSNNAKFCEEFGKMMNEVLSK